MNKDLGRRLARLEVAKAAASAPPRLSARSVLLDFVLGAIIGGAGPKESLADGIARALGYGSGRELHAALLDTDEGPDSFNARRTRTLESFLREHGFDPASVEVKRFVALVWQLFQELPESWHRCRALEAVENYALEEIEAARSDTKH